MASDRASLLGLRELSADTDLTLETTPDLQQNRTAHCRENLRAAFALAAKPDLQRTFQTLPAFHPAGTARSCSSAVGLAAIEDAKDSDDRAVLMKANAPVANA